MKQRPRYEIIRKLTFFMSGTPLFIPRVTTQPIRIGSITIGGNNPVAIQSMTNTSTADPQATLGQIEALCKAGCAIVRMSVPDQAAAVGFAAIRKQTTVPLVADIHFDYRLAIAAIEAGADKIRINPGNIGAPERVKAVVDAAKAANIPIRVGVNSGSLEKHLVLKYGGPTPEALAQSAAQALAQLESYGFDNMVVSIKASDVLTTILACRALSKLTQYPQHIGITESGTVRSGTIRSSVGIGTLLSEGIGDTIRVSLAADPVSEIFVAKEILKSLGLASGPIVIACPTCARTTINVEKLAEQVEAMVFSMNATVKVAVMGCVVNGPGEAREADIGVAGGNGEGLIFVKGKPVEKVKESEILHVLRKYIEDMPHLALS